VRVVVCEWLAWLLRMHREPEVGTMTSRRASCIRRPSTRAEDMSSYTLHGGHLANVCETNGDEWLASRRSTSLVRRGSATRSSLRRNNAAPPVERDDDWRRLQSTPADLDQDDRHTRKIKLQF